MRIHKILTAILIITTLLVVPSAFAQLDPGSGAHQPLQQQIGGDTGGVGAGDCLSAYSNCLYNCDTLGGNAALGCKIDCWYSYYGCLYNSATQ